LTPIDTPIKGCIIYVMEKEIKPGKIYTTEEARSFLKISESTMKRMIKNGIITAYKVSGHYRIWGDEILRLVSPTFERKVYGTYKNLREKTKKIIKNW